MRKALLIVAIATGWMLAPAAFVQQPAEAGVSWSIGSAFSVGGFDFTVVFGRPYGAFFDGPYYRTPHAFRYSGYGCHDGCFLRAGYSYHHRDCALVRHHFRSSGFRPPPHLWLTPRTYRPYSYYDGYRYDRRPYDRYRSHRHRNDRYRYDRHRYERHRHDRRYDDRYRYDRRRSRADDWDSDSDRRDRRYRSDRGRDRGRGEGYGRHDERRRRSAYDTRGRRHGGR